MHKLRSFKKEILRGEVHGRKNIRLRRMFNRQLAEFKRAGHRTERALAAGGGRNGSDHKGGYYEVGENQQRWYLDTLLLLESQYESLQTQSDWDTWLPTLNKAEHAYTQSDCVQAWDAIFAGRQGKTVQVEVFDNSSRITGHKDLPAFMRCRGPIDEDGCKQWITREMAEKPPLAGALQSYGKPDCLCGPCRLEDTYEIDYEE